MRASIVLLALLLPATACSRHRDEERVIPAPSAATPEEVRIQTKGAELDLALVGDTISAGLAPRTLAKARLETDPEKVNATGLGGSIERMVKSSVQSAVSARVAFPVSQLKDVAYRNGAIEFEWKEKPTRLFDQTNVNGTPFLESFRPEDAERFVAAVKARINLAQ